MAGALAVLILGRFGCGIARKSVRRAMESRKVDASLVPFVSNLVYFILFAAVIIAVLGLFGIETTSLIAVLGTAGLAIGLAGVAVGAGVYVVGNTLYNFTVDAIDGKDPSLWRSTRGSLARIWAGLRKAAEAVAGAFSPIVGANSTAKDAKALLDAARDSKCSGSN